MEAAGPAELTGEKVAERIMELMATSTTLAAHSNLNDENTDGQSYEIEDWGYKDEDEPEAKEEQEAREKRCTLGLQRCLCPALPRHG